MYAWDIMIKGAQVQDVRDTLKTRGGNGGTSLKMALTLLIVNYIMQGVYYTILHYTICHYIVYYMVGIAYLSILYHIAYLVDYTI